MTPEQREAALAAAARTRTARAELKARLKKGEITPNELLTSNDPIAGGLPVGQLLQSLPGIGKSKAEGMLAELDIDSKKRLRALGARQKAVLADRLAS
jgi:hypothetical protein